MRSGGLTRWAAGIRTGGAVGMLTYIPVHAASASRFDPYSSRPMSDTESEHPSVDAFGIRPPDAYAIEVGEADGGIVVLTLEGELDLAAAPVLGERLAAAQAGRAVVVDMSEATFVDSSALRELLRASTAFRDAGTPLLLAGVQAPVARLLELTRTTEAFELAPTVAAAFKRLAASP